MAMAAASFQQHGKRVLHHHGHSQSLSPQPSPVISSRSVRSPGVSSRRSTSPLPSLRAPLSPSSVSVSTTHSAQSDPVSLHGEAVESGGSQILRRRSSIMSRHRTLPLAWADEIETPRPANKQEAESDKPVEEDATAEAELEEDDAVESVAESASPEDKAEEETEEEEAGSRGPTPMTHLRSIFKTIIATGRFRKDQLNHAGHPAEEKATLGRREEEEKKAPLVRPEARRSALALSPRRAAKAQAADGEQKEARPTHRRRASEPIWEPSPLDAPPGALPRLPSVQEEESDEHEDSMPEATPAAMSTSISAPDIALRDHFEGGAFRRRPVAATIATKASPPKAKLVRSASALPGLSSAPRRHSRLIQAAVAEVSASARADSSPSSDEGEVEEADNREPASVMEKKRVPTLVSLITLLFTALLRPMVENLAMGAYRLVLFPILLPYWVRDDPNLFRNVWQVCVSLSIVYNTLMVPMRIAFVQHEDPWVGSLDLVADLVYVVDCAVMLYQRLEETEALDVAEQSRSHLLQRNDSFGLAFASILPLAWMVHFVHASLGYLPWATEDFLVRSRLLYFFRLVRLLRVHQLYLFFLHWEAQNLRRSHVSPVVLKLFKLGVSLYLGAHVIGCAYFFISVLESDDADALEHNDWIAPADIREDESVILQYVHSVYWGFSAMTGNGSDIGTPKTLLELLFTISVLLVGITMFATLVGNLSHIVLSLNERAQQFISRMEAINAFAEKNNVPDELRDRLRNAFEYLHIQDKTDNEWEAMAVCPKYLRNEVTYALYSGIVRNVRLFKFCEEGFIRSLVILLQPQVCLPGDTLIRQGEVGREMYLVVSGKMKIIAKGAVVATIEDGSYVGEVAVLYEQKRIASVVAITYCDLLMLSKDDMDSVVDHYPKVLEQMETEASLYPSIRKMLKERHKKILATKQKHQHDYVHVQPSPTGTPVSPRSPMSPNPNPLGHAAPYGWYSIGQQEHTQQHHHYSRSWSGQGAGEVADVSHGESLQPPLSPFERERQRRRFEFEQEAEDEDEDEDEEEIGLAGGDKDGTGHYERTAPQHKRTMSPRHPVVAAALASELATSPVHLSPLSSPGPVDETTSGLRRRRGRKKQGLPLKIELTRGKAE